MIVNICALCISYRAGEDIIESLGEAGCPQPHVERSGTWGIDTTHLTERRRRDIVVETIVYPGCICMVYDVDHGTLISLVG